MAATNAIYAAGLPDGHEAAMYPPSTQVHVLYEGVEFATAWSFGFVNAAIAGRESGHMDSTHFVEFK